MMMVSDIPLMLGCYHFSNNNCILVKSKFLTEFEVGMNVSNLNTFLLFTVYSTIRPLSSQNLSPFASKMILKEEK